jgi:pyrrolidone-carboxylate peptidase
MVAPSIDAGRYLCEYIFYKSLDKSQESGIPVLFVHVPSAGCPYSVPEMTEIVISLAALMVDVKLS